MAKFKREDIINSIIKMRIEKGCSTKTIIEDFLQGELGYKVSMAYTLYKEARVKINQIYQNNNESAINEAVGQLEDLYEKALSDGNKKLALDVRKEINKLVGLYAAEKVDITSGGEKTTEIKLIQINKNGDLGND
jgi:hypothetical protein